MTRLEGHLARFFDKLSQFDLLIIDDCGIKKLNTEQVLDLMEIVEDWHTNKATIFASQLPVAKVRNS